MPAYLMMMELNLSPRPVNVTTPTIRPAAAQVTATARTPTEPAFSASTSLAGYKAHSFRRKLRTKAITVAQNTAAMAV